MSLDRLLPALVAVPLLASCAGSSCGELSALRAERDAARAAYLRLATSPDASPEVTGSADADVHVLDRQVHGLEQSCAGR